MGALVASGFFWFIKSCEYETANPGQDFDDLEASAFNPEEDLARPVISPTAVADRTASRDLAMQNSQERTCVAGFSPIHGRADTIGSKTTNAQPPTV
jgi:hypothetical protein